MSPRLDTVHRPAGSSCSAAASRRARCTSSPPSACCCSCVVHVVRGLRRRGLERDALDDHRLVRAAARAGGKGQAMKKITTLMRARERERRRLLRGAVAAAGSALLAGCDRLSQNEPAFVDALKSAEQLSRAAQKVLAPRRAMAQEFGPEQIARRRSAATARSSPRDADYGALRRGGFADYRLAVGGLVEQPAEYSLDALRAMPARTQITRHDCVEGWSCIGKWKGVPLAALLERAKPQAEARFVVFRCFDSMRRRCRRPRLALLREHRHGRRAPSADHPRLRAERPRPAGQQRRAAALPGRAPARLQAGQVRARDRAGRELRRTSAAAMAATGRTRATSGTAGSEEPGVAAGGLSAGASRRGGRRGRRG